jgi:hypothetical protein
MSGLTLPLLGLLGLLWVVFFVYCAAVYLRQLFWFTHGRPAAIRKGCRVCGEPAARAFWHSTAPRPLRPFGPITTTAWCQRHYDEVRRRNSKPPVAAAK